MADELAVKNAAEIMAFGRGGGRMATSMKLETQEQRRAFMRSMGECDLRLTEQANTEMHVADYMVHEVSITNKQTGELNECVRMVLFLADGKTAECVSDTLLQSMKNLVWVYGGKLPETGVRVKVMSRKKGERSIYWFEDVTPAVPQTARRK